MRNAATDRSATRDLQFTNAGTPPDGPTVGAETLTRMARDRAAARTGPAGPGVAQDPMFRAGQTPRAGQSRPTGEAGARPTTGGQTQHRGPGRNGTGRNGQGR